MIRSIAASLLFVTGIHAATHSYISDGPNPELLYAVNTPAVGQQTSTLNGSSFDNCLQITPNFNFHWAIRDGMFKAAHEGFSTPDTYFAFAIVANPTAPNRMAGADTIVTSFDQGTNQAMATDYFMNSVSECSNGRGVCPDTMIDNAANNAVFNVSGFYQDSIHVVSYVRPLAGADAEDLTIEPDRTQFFLFAQGPMNSNGLPMYHMANRGAIEINLNRDPIFQCTQLLPNGPDVGPNGPGFNENGASIATASFALVAALVSAALL